MVIIQHTTLINTTPNNIYFNIMKTTHKFRTNQLGITYNQFGENLINQLQLNYKKLYGKDYKQTNTRESQTR